MAATLVANAHRAGAVRSNGPPNFLRHPMSDALPLMPQTTDAMHVGTAVSLPSARSDSRLVSYLTISTARAE
jgi:hypothetical protein